MGSDIRYRYASDGHSFGVGDRISLDGRNMVVTKTFTLPPMTFDEVIAENDRAIARLFGFDEDGELAAAPIFTDCAFYPFLTPEELTQIRRQNEWNALPEKDKRNGEALARSKPR